jgi:hypothetical protein
MCMFVAKDSCKTPRHLQSPVDNLACIFTAMAAIPSARMYQFDSSYAKLVRAGAELCSVSLSLDHGFHCPIDVSNVSSSAFFRICATAA